MPPDPQRLADTESWLRKATNDLRYAAIDLAAEPPARDDAVFHCQQAAEKALKAFLVWYDVPFPKTHDLGKLGNLAVQLDSSLEQLVDRVVDLSKVRVDVSLPWGAGTAHRRGSGWYPRSRAHGGH